MRGELAEINEREEPYLYGTLPQHFSLLIPAALQESPIDGDKLSIREAVDCDRIRTVLKDSPELLPTLLDQVLCLFSPDSLPDLVSEFSKLRLRVTSFLEIEVRTIVDRGDHDLLAPTACKEDEWYIPEPLPDCLQEPDSVHLRHLVVGDNDIEGSMGEHFEGLPRRFRNADVELPEFLEIYLGDIQEGGFIIDIKNTYPSFHGTCM
ncbi:MAG: hypothetical protein A4E42_01770 [Methanoregulaceae archaeon PtaU1.Bin222]|nr:MAG: hypothetical protein A4E42_01770 [Methanoregulaceae archaeon PtaU1.Bin222]